MWVTHLRSSVLSIITGGGKWVEITIPMDGSARPEGSVPSGNAQPPLPRREPSNGNGRGTRKREPRVILAPNQSAKLRDKMLLEISTLASPDLTMDWAKQGLAVKNSLSAADAKLVEDAFERRLTELACDGKAAGTNDHATIAPADTSPFSTARATAQDQPPLASIDKSVLTIGAPRRYRNREHLRYVMQQPCLVCGRKPSDPHHLRYMQPRALGRKVSDEFAVPLCRVHHRAAHRAGDERAWWKTAGIDPTAIARKLWQETRGTRRRHRVRIRETFDALGRPCRRTPAPIKFAQPKERGPSMQNDIARRALDSLRTS
jgi:hypothetical protein